MNSNNFFSSNLPSSDYKSLLERASAYEGMARAGSCRITIEVKDQKRETIRNVTFTYAHDIKAVNQQTTARLGPWLSALSTDELALVFPHCKM